MFPKNSQYLKNPLGTAPGFWLQIGKNKSDFFFVPGVPREMRQMLTEQVLSRICQKFTVAFPVADIKTLITFGLSEADLGEHLEIINKNFPQLKFGTRACFPEIQINLYARGKNKSSVKTH